MNQNELIKGEIYTWKSADESYILEHGINGKQRYIDLKSKSYGKTAGFTPPKGYELATSRERKWLQKCIELDKFIKYEDIKKRTFEIY